jgi:serine kinase
VEWGDLLEYINSMRPLSVGRARTWTCQLAVAIEYLHKLGYAHRDIKCENLLISGNMNIKLCDFGFATNVLNTGGNLIMHSVFRFMYHNF